MVVVVVVIGLIETTLKGYFSLCLIFTHQTHRNVKNSRVRSYLKHDYLIEKNSPKLECSSYTVTSPGNFSKWFYRVLLKLCSEAGKLLYVTTCEKIYRSGGGGGGVTSVHNKRGCAILTRKYLKLRPKNPGARNARLSF